MLKEVKMPRKPNKQINNAKRPTKQSTNQSKNHTISSTNLQPNKQQTYQTNKPISTQPSNKPKQRTTNKTNNQTTQESTQKHTDQPTNHLNHQPTNQNTHIHQLINQTSKQSTNHPINPSTNQLTNQATNQTINQPNNQPTNQSTNQNSIGWGGEGSGVRKRGREGTISDEGENERELDIMNNIMEGENIKIGEPRDLMMTEQIIHGEEEGREGNTLERRTIKVWTLNADGLGEGGDERILWGQLAQEKVEVMLIQDHRWDLNKCEFLRERGKVSNLTYWRGAHTYASPGNIHAGGGHIGGTAIILRKELAGKILSKWTGPRG
jgi:hypothetical protein